MRGKWRWELLIGLLLVLAMHAAALYGLWNYRLLPSPAASVTLFVNLLHPPPVEKKPEPPPPPSPPKKVRLVKPQTGSASPQPVLVSQAPLVSAADLVAPPPPPAPVPVVEEAPPGPPASLPTAESEPPTGPVMLTADLALACPQRAPPVYPALSRRLKEQGKLVLRVELDESGQVIEVRVKQSSGFPRLDEAGMAAVRQWRCNAPTRAGEPVKAVALQPFNFVLEGR